MSKVVIAAILFFTLNVNAQVPSIQWENTIGGSDNDWFRSMQQCSDGGYILGGASRSNISGDKGEDSQGSADFWVVKLDSFGVIEWENTIGGMFSDDPASIQQCSDGGYILCGNSTSSISGDKTENNIGNNSCWVVKLDALGNIEWQNTIGGDEYDMESSIWQCDDGGYILGISSDSPISGDKTQNSKGLFDYWVLKLDTFGTIQWQNTIGGSGNDLVEYVQQTSDGGYVIGGRSDSPISGDKTEDSIGGYDYWVVKLDTAGAIQWENTIGGALDDYFRALQQCDDDGYILGGYTSSSISGDKTENSMGFDDIWIVKLDTAGYIQWQNTIGGSLSDRLFTIEQCSDGGYILGGESQSDISGDKTENSQGGYDYWAVKLDTVGAIQWQSTIGGTGNDHLKSIEQTSDGSFVMGGFSNSPISGDKTENSQGVNDYWVVKLGTLIDPPTSIESIAYSQLNASPNPFSSSTIIDLPVDNTTYTFTMHDVLGNVIKELKVEESKIKVNRDNLSEGIYIYKLYSAEGVLYTGKLSIQ